ncbi:MAG: cryptochrome/photolyase family protein [Methylotenera sp.]|uniref:cryptochrome/photolyase family protein n=1 Tax=Methylotenera sp. TaxID=2051956 RepID=UPI002721C50E|nr:cryptochrome/photolyase family protein [Methylotenera sp.]MDO9392910.1 cryptochrome/photolyase family protein [Methylotenera sp.]MDP1524077.1 cryptochrome/photolyase family protein [Methylotenera sp.]MDZ4211660.1 cryptochrome/photolyase family protein [Methylotenera sp.]
MTRNLILILGDQLNFDNPALEGFDASQDAILMVEVRHEATQVWSHKARIVLFLSAMRHFYEALIRLYSCGLHSSYLKLGEHDFVTLKAAWAHQIATLKPQRVIVCEPGEYRIQQDLIGLCKAMNTPLSLRDDTHFICSKADFEHWATDGKKLQKKELRMEFFYRKMRQKYGVLMEGSEPVGGTWNYDIENRKSFNKAGPQNVPIAPQVNIDEVTQAVIDTVEQSFANHPGSLANFIWPVTRAEALKFLDDFINNKLANFGAHQDAMWQSDNSSQSPYLWHSLLSTSLNLKLLNPREVIAAAVFAYQKHQSPLTKALPLASVEGFIRQILGWREFIRGVYWLDMPQMGESNHYYHTRSLPNWYWTGETHMNCMRQTVNDTMKLGYTHHIQRLMVTGMFGVLAEINPREVEAWYLAVYVDAVEWVELPNVAGMALYANGGRFTSKPYVASGAYINRMSNYCNQCKYKPELKMGENACPTTTLYWNFLITHYYTFSRNPRTALMAKNIDRLSGQDIAAVQTQAQYLLNNINAI